MKKSILILLSVMITMVSCGQKNAAKKVKQKPGHNITFDIADMPNEEMFIAYHYGGKHYISDTLMLDEKGHGVLKGEEHKPNGVYLAVFPSLGNKYFEFLISDQHFGISTKKDVLGKEMEFKNSPENDIFNSDMLEMADLRTKSSKLKTELDAAQGSKKDAVQAEMDELNKTYLAKREKIMTDYPDYFYTDLLGLMKEVDIPEPPKNEAGELIDSSFGWKYWKNHYWDYTDFSEEGILRTPIYHNKLITFMTKRTEPIQDSVITSCHAVLNKALANEEVFKYTLVTLLNKYANSKIMGDDAVYVDLIDSYYKKGLAPWTDSAQLAKMTERADALAPLLIGKTSPDLTMRAPDLKTQIRLHDLPSDYSIVFVWDPDCGHCKKAVPHIKKFYDTYGKEKSVMVYAISTVNYEQVGEWKDFIKEHDLTWTNVADPYHETPFRKVYDISSTPQIFVLDKDKKIIAKRIGAQQLEEFFFNYFKRFDKEKFKGMEGLTFEAATDSTQH